MNILIINCGANLQPTFQQLFAVATIYKMVTIDSSLLSVYTLIAAIISQTI